MLPNAVQLFGTCRDAGKPSDHDEAAAHRSFGLLGNASAASPGLTVYQQTSGRSIVEAIADQLAVGRRFVGSMRLSRLAKTLPAINWLQTVGSLEWQHPPWILMGKPTDLIQLPNLVLRECEFDRREIILKLVEAFRANDDRGYHRL